jgi:hypothetical protein
MRTILATASALIIGVLVTTSGEAKATGIIRSKSNVCNNFAVGGGGHCQSEGGGIGHRVGRGDVQKSEGAEAPKEKRQHAPYKF